VGRAFEVSAPPGAIVRDLGETALLPGLVNAHSHLELTVMRGLLEDLPFRDWIARLTDVKLTRLNEDDLLDSSRLGALEAIAGGVTCSADTCDSGLALDALNEAGLSGVVFQEVFGPDPAQADESMRKLGDKLAALEARATSGGRVRIGVSPHAPYTVSAELFGCVTRLALDRDLPVAIHAAESHAEERFMRDGEGPFAENLARRGIRWSPPGRSTVGHLAAIGVLEARPLLIHAVRADAADLDVIAAAGARIAHCPKSNAKLGHGVAPLAAMLGRGIAVGIGTDSVASNNVCDMLDESRAATLAARAATRDELGLSARRALELATLGGARALGLDGEVGTLERGKRADLCAVSLAGLHLRPVYDVEASVVFSASARDVALTMAGGCVLFDRSKQDAFATLDVARLRVRLGEIQRKVVSET
jgi:cytosine/adenosine deaminase-related metal-dependent hydrolase